MVLATNKILAVGRETQIVHFVNKIMPIMFKQMTVNDHEILERATECLGNLAKAGGSDTAENVENTLQETSTTCASTRVRLLCDLCFRPKRPESQVLAPYL